MRALSAQPCAQPVTSTVLVLALRTSVRSHSNQPEDRRTLVRVSSSSFFIITVIVIFIITARPTQHGLLDPRRQRGGLQGHRADDPGERDTCVARQLGELAWLTRAHVTSNTRRSCNRIINYSWYYWLRRCSRQSFHWSRIAHWHVSGNFVILHTCSMSDVMFVCFPQELSEHEKVSEQVKVTQRGNSCAQYYIICFDFMIIFIWPAHENEGKSMSDSILIGQFNLDLLRKIWP